MNKYQDALKIMCYKCHKHNSCKSKTCSPINILLELVDKATPLEPKKIILDSQTKETLYVCKCCDQVLDDFEKYCCDCGQAIDWENE